ncbi:MAG: arginine--tRNA ligase [Euryarchaeota archaeon]|nr:arginine--tRNA ligase [Euryarchaeota archaeon]
MDILGIFRAEANRRLSNAGINGTVEPAKEGFGDFTFPCFPLAKELRKNPAAIAKELAEKIEPGTYFEKIEAVGPYLNFHISTKKLNEMTIQAILSRKLYAEPVREKIVLEHTSANPTGPLHVGRARNPIIGDTMARILRAYGHEVEVHYFVNDAGMQVATLLWGIKNLPTIQRHEKCDHALVRNYQTASKLASEKHEIEMEIRELMKRYESGDEELRKLAKEKVGCVLKGIQDSLERLNIKIDRFVWESELIPKAKEIALLLKEYVEEEEGAYYLNLKKMGIELQKNKFFLYRSDGTTLYFLRDIAYHMYKGELANILIDVLGEDHKLHFQAIKEVVEKLNPEISVSPLFYSFVRLPEGKMSTRKGTVVYLDDLIDEGKEKALEILKERNYTEQEMDEIAERIATSSIRFAILNIQEEKPIVFRWEKALSFEGESAPFVIYTYARACSILRKSEEKTSIDYTRLTHTQERKLIKLMAQYPDIIKQAVNNLSPYVMAKYALALAMQFNQFYRDCPVLNAEPELKNARLALVKAFKEHMGTILKILGLATLEKM